jgi:hypothetical protein
MTWLLYQRMKPAGWKFTQRAVIPQRSVEYMTYLK